MSTLTMVSRDSIITSKEDYERTETLEIPDAEFPVVDEIKEAQATLRAQKKAEGLKPIQKTTRTNSKCPYETIEEEQEERHQVVEEHLKVYRKVFPRLMKEFKKIKDPRDPQKIEHKLISVLIYGIFLFILKIPSRRQANKILTRPQFLENIRTIFPELQEVDDLPHGDTVNRILSEIDVEKIQIIKIKLIKQLMRNKKFDRYKRSGRYIINIDGTQKFCSYHPFSKEALQRNVSTKEGKKTQYYVYILEANLAFVNGLSIPLLTEFCEFSKGDIENDKQDCEQRAFKRLGRRLKKLFPRLPITINLDGLYPNGPIMSFCRNYNWDFMMVLKDDQLPQVYEEAKRLKRLCPENTLENIWGDRKQNFWWVNDIEYNYGNNGHHTEIVHVVVCEETWQEVNKEGKIVEKSRKFVWISAKPITENNVVSRCNKIGRHRWDIEEEILVEKHHGYQLEHAFSKDWTAMKAFHYIMQLARLLDILCHYSIDLYERIQSLGHLGLVMFFRETLLATVLDKNRIRKFLKRRHYLQLIW
ncbi:MAG: transposase family protein [Halanaerobiales bacterium]